MCRTCFSQYWALSDVLACKIPVSWGILCVSEMAMFVYTCMCKPTCMNVNSLLLRALVYLSPALLFYMFHLLHMECVDIAQWFECTWGYWYSGAKTLSLMYTWNYQFLVHSIISTELCEGCMVTCILPFLEQFTVDETPQQELFPIEEAIVASRRVVTCHRVWGSGL